MLALGMLDKSPAFVKLGVSVAIEKFETELEHYKVMFSVSKEPEALNKVYAIYKQKKLGYYEAKIEQDKAETEKMNSVMNEIGPVTIEKEKKEEKVFKLKPKINIKRGGK